MLDLRRKAVLVFVSHAVRWKMYSVQNALRRFYATYRSLLGCSLQKLPEQWDGYYIPGRQIHRFAMQLA